MAIEKSAKTAEFLTVEQTHQLQGEEEDEEDATGEHGEAQQQHQRLVLADVRELAVQHLIFQLLVVQQVLPFGWHGSHFLTEAYQVLTRSPRSRRECVCLHSKKCVEEDVFFRGHLLAHDAQVFFLRRGILNRCLSCPPVVNLRVSLSFCSLYPLSGVGRQTLFILCQPLCPFGPE